MGGDIDYSALPIIFSMLGVDDAEQMIRLMRSIIKAHKESNE